MEGAKTAMAFGHGLQNLAPQTLILKIIFLLYFYQFKVPLQRGAIISEEKPLVLSFEQLEEVKEFEE